jgi:hypothetical protein
MFLRVVRANVSKDVKREYVCVVEAYRGHDGKTRHQHSSDRTRPHRL